MLARRETTMLGQDAPANTARLFQESGVLCKCASAVLRAGFWRVFIILVVLVAVKSDRAAIILLYDLAQRRSSLCLVFTSEAFYGPEVSRVAMSCWSGVSIPRTVSFSQASRHSTAAAASTHLSIPVRQMVHLFLQRIRLHTIALLPRALFDFCDVLPGITLAFMRAMSVRGNFLMVDVVTAAVHNVCV